MAVDVDHGDAESFRINPGQFGNIGRDLAAIRALPHLVGDFSDDPVEIGCRAVHPLSFQSYFDIRSGVPCPPSMSMAAPCSQRPRGETMNDTSPAISSG